MLNYQRYTIVRLGWNNCIVRYSTSKQLCKLYCHRCNYCIAITHFKCGEKSAQRRVKQVLYSTEFLWAGYFWSLLPLLEKKFTIYLIPINWHKSFRIRTILLTQTSVLSLLLVLSNVVRYWQSETFAKVIEQRRARECRENKTFAKLNAKLRHISQHSLTLCWAMPF